MIRALRHMQEGVSGVIALLGFKPDWRKHFDVSVDGVAYSFAGVFLALPAYVFLIACINYLVAENPMLFSPEATISLAEMAMGWARFWLLFPITAALMCYLLGVQDRFASWLITHNWTVFLLVHVQLLIFMLYPLGLADSTAIGSALSLYTLLRIVIHVRVAHASLGLPIPYAVAAAAIPMMIDWLVARAF